MPHLIIEYSANLEPELDVSELVRITHEAALETGVFPIGGVRTRAQRRDHYRIADGHSDNCYVHVDVQIGTGRSLDVKKAAGEAIFGAITATLAPIYKNRPLGISMELTEIDPNLSWRQNNLHDIVTMRSEKSKEKVL